MQPAQVSQTPSPTTGHKPAAGRTTIQQPVKQKPQSQKGRQNDTAKKYVPGKGARGNFKVERSNLPGKRFRVVILKMIQDSGKRTEAEMKKIQEIFHSDLEELKNKQTDEKYNN